MFSRIVSDIHDGMCEYVKGYVVEGARERERVIETGRRSLDILVGWEKKLGISRFRWPFERWMEG